MAILSSFALEQAFGAIIPTQLSLHTGFNEEGALEIVGGTYARQPVIFTVSTDLFIGLIASNLGDPVATFSVPAGNTVSFVGLWDDLNNFIGMVPLSSSPPLLFILSEDLTTIICPNAFSLLDGMKVTSWRAPGLVLSPLDEGGIYTVTNATENTFQLIATVGEDTVNPLVFGEVGVGYLQQVQPLTFNVDGQFGISVITIDGEVIQG